MRLTTGFVKFHSVGGTVPKTAFDSHWKCEVSSYAKYTKKFCLTLTESQYQAIDWWWSRQSVSAKRTWCSRSWSGTWHLERIRSCQNRVKLVPAAHLPKVQRVSVLSISLMWGSEPLVLDQRWVWRRWCLHCSSLTPVSYRLSIDSVYESRLSLQRDANVAAHHHTNLQHNLQLPTSCVNMTGEQQMHSFYSMMNLTENVMSENMFPSV